MKLLRTLTCFAFVAAITAASASADVVSSLVINDGTNLVTLSTGAGSTSTQASGAADFNVPQAIIQEITAGGVTYDTLVGADGFAEGGNNNSGVVEGVLHSVGGTAPTASVAFGDLDLTTGSLDPYGTGGGPEEYFNFASQTISSNTVFFLFGNGTGVNNVALVNSAGLDISNALSFASIGGEVEFADFAFSRTNGGDLSNREVYGNIFAVSEFTLNAGFTVADIAGFRGAGATFDGHDAGIASITVPEPSSALLLTVGGLCWLRRRK